MKAIKVSDLLSVRLGRRDYEIIRFVLQMKFAGIEELHQKFFKVSQSGVESRSLRWARERIGILCKLRLLSPASVVTENKRYYIATWKGYHVIRQEFQLDGYAKPTGRIDIRTFEHDLAVLRLRLELESTLAIVNWVSDRELKVASERFQGLRGEYAPDAIYQLPSGDQVALEVEISRKARNRYHQKIQHYINTCRERMRSDSKLSKVQIVCSRKSVFEIWKLETRPYSFLFQVEYKDILDFGKRVVA